MDMDTDTAALTYVKVLTNFSTKIVLLKNHEDNNNESCGPQDVETAPSLKIPWATSKEDYNDRGRKLSVGYWGGDGKLVNNFWLWENSGAIYYNTTDAWSPTAPKVPGDSWGRGVKAFAIRETNGTFSIKLVKIP